MISRNVSLIACDHATIARVQPGCIFTEALTEFQHVNCMVVRTCEVKSVVC